MSDEIKLPTTVEEYQRARREAFVEGSRWARWGIGSTAPDDINAFHEARCEAARELYPIKKRVPREITLDYGRWGPTRLKVVDGEFWAWSERHHTTWYRQYENVTPENIRAMADLLANPDEAVSE